MCETSVPNELSSFGGACNQSIPHCVKISFPMSSRHLAAALMAVPLCETFIPNGFASFGGVANGSFIARTTIPNEFPQFGGAADGSRIV